MKNLVLKNNGSEIEGLVVLGVGIFLAPKKFVESKEEVEKAMVWFLSIEKPEVWIKKIVREI